MSISAKISSKGQITLPKAVREEMGLTEGDSVEFLSNGNGSYLIKSSNQLEVIAQAQLLMNYVFTQESNRAVILQGGKNQGKSRILSELVKHLRNQKKPLILVEPLGELASYIGEWDKDFELFARLGKIPGVAITTKEELHKITSKDNYDFIIADHFLDDDIISYVNQVRKKFSNARVVISGQDFDDEKLYKIIPYSKIDIKFSKVSSITDVNQSPKDYMNNL